MLGGSVSRLSRAIVDLTTTRSSLECQVLERLRDELHCILETCLQLQSEQVVRRPHWFPVSHVPLL